MAREQKPAIIFIDEIDSIAGERGGSGPGKSEDSRKVLTELLVQMDAVGSDDTGVLILGATNLPWELDQAIKRRWACGIIISAMYCVPDLTYSIRRLEKRIYIPLPDLEARRQMFQLNVGTTSCNLVPNDFRRLAELTERCILSPEPRIVVNSPWTVVTLDLTLLLRSRMPLCSRWVLLSVPVTLSEQGVTCRTSGPHALLWIRPRYRWHWNKCRTMNY